MPPAFDLVCLSHLRWDFVYQRPQHLLSRAARDRRVFFVEEPIFDVVDPRLDVLDRDGGIRVIVPHLPEGVSSDTAEGLQRALLGDLYSRFGIGDHTLWYYTPMAMAFSCHLRPAAVVYDCMDELSAFRGASPVIREREAELLSRADLVFTGGQSLYEAKRDKHPHVHSFPSSVETAHFRKARTAPTEPADQAGIPSPRLGFFGVIDERLDIELLESIATLRPEWQFVMVGPVTKIEEADLPRRPNIHYLGSKQYAELPAYLSGWDVALMPFTLNESTRFISPTKTPEYLAAGRPVVSTSIRDVVRPYGEQGLVRIADTPESFVAAAEAAMKEDAAARILRADQFLSHMSWDRTWARMAQLIDGVLAGHHGVVARPAARESEAAVLLDPPGRGRRL